MKSPAPVLLLVGSLLALSFSVAAAQPGWIPQISGTPAPLYSVCFTDLTHGYAVGAWGVGLKTTDGGDTWLPMAMGVGADLHGVSFVGAIGLVVGDEGLILRTTDSGLHWSIVQAGVTDGLRSVQMNGNAAVCGGLSQTILRSTDAGASWLISQTGYFGGGFAGVSMLSPQIAFVGGSNSIFAPLAGRSTDGGAHWSFHTFYPDGNEGDIRSLSFTDASVGYAALGLWDGRGAISRTADGGMNWSSLLFPSELNGIAFPVSDAGQVGFAVGGGGTILKTANAGSSWQSQESGTGQTLRAVSFLDFDHGYAVGDNGVILRTQTGGESPTSGVAVEPEGQILRAWPNPFRANTEIRLRGAPDGPVDLCVFDLRGRMLRTLRMEHGSAGTGSVVWNGTDDSGRPVPTGAYYIQLRSRARSENLTILPLR
jgi:photosystem II stability/assembly factor-like uncharacterized protein